MDRAKADAFLMPLISQAINGHGVSALNVPKQYEPKLQVATGNLVSPGYYSGFTSEDIPDESIAIIDVRGVITKYWVWWMESASTVIMTDWVKQAESNPKIKAILFRVDSPGGMVFGTRTLTETIHNCSKQTLAYVNDGMAASCGYWIAAACDYVWVSQSTDIVGSIGTKAVIVDYSGWYETQKIKVHDIKADQSSDKNRVVEEALKNNYKPIKEQELNPMAAQFIDDIKMFRGDRLNIEVADPFTGETFMYEQAKSIGLVDDKGTIEEAFAFLNSKTNSIINYKSETNMSLKKWLSSATTGDDGDKDVTIKASELEQLRTDMTAAQGELETAQNENSALKADKSRLEGELATAQSDLTAMTTDRDQWKEKAEKTGKQAGANHNQPKKEGSEGGNTEEDVKTEEEHFGGFAHNQEAMKELENFI